VSKSVIQVSKPVSHLVSQIHSSSLFIWIVAVIWVNATQSYAVNSVLYNDKKKFKTRLLPIQGGGSEKSCATLKYFNLSVMFEICYSFSKTVSDSTACV